MLRRCSACCRTLRNVCITGQYSTLQLQHLRPRIARIPGPRDPVSQAIIGAYYACQWTRPQPALSPLHFNFEIRARNSPARTNTVPSAHAAAAHSPPAPAAASAAAAAAIGAGAALAAGLPLAAVVVGSPRSARSADSLGASGAGGGGCGGGDGSSGGLRVGVGNGAGGWTGVGAGVAARGKKWGEAGGMPRSGRSAGEHSRFALRTPRRGGAARSCQPATRSEGGWEVGRASQTATLRE
jgi:hypothetical protein